MKFFPAGLLGGPAAIRALTAPFTTMSFMPSGGVNADNMADYLAIPAVPAVSGSSVLIAEHVDQVVDAGAQFVVSPGLSLEVLARSEQRGVPALPGVATSSELMTAVRLGLTEVKFFPAGLLGGPAAIRALTAPFTTMSFMPSGGVNANNMADYLAIPAVPAVSGSWMVDPDLLAQGRWDEVAIRSAAAIAAAKTGRSRSVD